VVSFDNFSIISEARNAQDILAEKLQMKIKSFQKQKYGYLIYPSLPTSRPPSLF